MSKSHTRISRRAMLAGAASLPLLPGAAQAQQKVLTIGSAFSPISLDPSLSGNGRAGMAVIPAYEPLIRTAPDGSYRAALATAWEMAPDSKSVVFTLRQDARFSDGDPVTAEAAKKSIDYFRTKKGGPFATNLQTVTAIDVLDPYRFKITLSAPQPGLVTLFDSYWNGGLIISPKGVDNPDMLARETRGAGPYKLDPAATIAGKSYTYVPNEHYYDKRRVKWDKVVISVFEDQNAGIQAMKAGQLKLLSSDPFTGNANAANLPKDLRIVSDPVGWTGLVMNDRDGEVQPYLKDVRVRQAINYALDRKLINKALFGKFADPSDQLQSKGFMGYDAKNEERYPYDPEKAKALLKEAGYANGFELKVAYVNNTMSQFLQQALSGQLRKVGITVKPMEAQSFGALRTMADNKAFAAIIVNSNSGVPNLAKFQTLDPRGSFNQYGSKDATLTRLMDEASNLPLSQAGEAWKKAYAHVVEIAWFAVVSAIHVVYFASSTIKTPAIGQSIVMDLTDVEPA
ncbi:MAG: ABC transporter substrate-binding protein [Reyranellaceae bacterium]